VVLALSLVLGVVAGGATTGSAPAGAQTNPYARGPAPTSASIEANGTFAHATTTVARQTTFGGGTIYYPTATDAGTFGAVAISPGFTENQSAVSWLGPRLASHGFVVFTIDMLNTLTDAPNGRADQLQAALDYLVNTSTVRTRVDRNRLATSGHSMGGGGSIEAAKERPSLQAVVALQPWHSVTDWSSVRVPTMIIGGQNDIIAPVGSHSEPFYTSIPAATEKAYAEIAGGDHFVSNSANATTSRYAVSWLKRWVDDDTRYDQFLCPRPARSDLSEYRDTCPHGGGTTPPTTPPPTTPPPTTPPAPECPWWAFWCWFS
jgi:alpha-beta hydrolase superfamily lysophospholipase